jgi:hypothetical protein
MPSDISFTVLDRIRQGRRLMQNDDGSTYYDPMEPVEPLPEASVEQPSADPAPPIKPARKPRKKHGA